MALLVLMADVLAWRGLRMCLLLVCCCNSKLLDHAAVHSAAYQWLGQQTGLRYSQQTHPPTKNQFGAQDDHSVVAVHLCPCSVAARS